jgi:hypothetical protein
MKRAMDQVHPGKILVHTARPSEPLPDAESTHKQAHLNQTLSFQIQHASPAHHFNAWH